MRSKRKNVVLFLILVLLPLQRFLASPALDSIRLVDMALLFGAGMAAGALVTSFRGSPVQSARD